MGIPTATALYGSLNALLNVFLATRVSKMRRLHKVSTGYGDSKDVELAVRIHGNNAEFVPLFIVMLLLAELCGAASLYLHSVGGLVLVARVLHAFGMPKRAPNPYRVAGTAGTWTAIIVTALYTLWLRSKV